MNSGLAHALRTGATHRVKSHAEAVVEVQRAEIPKPRKPQGWQPRIRVDPDEKRAARGELSGEYIPTWVPPNVDVHHPQFF